MQEYRRSLTELQRWLLTEGRLLLDDPARLPKATLSAAQRVCLEQQIFWRKRSQPRFPDPGKWLWTDRSLSQASDWTTASYKASLFPVGETVADGCCGAGADAAALAGRCRVLAVDLDPWMVALTDSNAAAHGREVNVYCEVLSRASLREARWLHVDPDRRMGDAKTLDAISFSPPLSDVIELSRSVSGTMIKIAPSSQLDEKSTEFLEAGWIRVWIGSRGECRQQLLIGGEQLVSRFVDRAMSSHQTSSNPAQKMAYALLLKELKTEPMELQETYVCGQPDNSELHVHSELQVQDEVGPLIYDLNATLFASNLHTSWAKENELLPITGQYGFYSARKVLDTPWASGFEVLDILPWDDRKIRKWLKRHEVGTVEVKSRLLRLDASTFQKRFSQPTGQPVSLLVTRVGTRTHCIICRRLPHRKPSCPLP